MNTELKPFYLKLDLHNFLVLNIGLLLKIPLKVRGFSAKYRLASFMDI